MTLITNTPIWVWAILAFLIVIGIKQFKPRKTKLFQPLIAPAIFSPLLLMGIFNTPQPIIGVVALLIGVSVGLGFGGLAFTSNPMLTAKDSNWYQRGSTIPLLLYLYIFITRYIAIALPYLPIKNVPDYAPNIVVGFTGIGVGALMAMVVFRRVK